MKKEIILVFIVGIAIVILNSVFSKIDKNRDQSKKADAKSLQTSMEKDGNKDNKSIANDNLLNKADNYYYEEIVKNFFIAEKFAIDKDDNIFLDNFMDLASKFGKDELKRIEELKLAKKSNTISEIKLEKIVEENIKNEKKSFYVNLKYNDSLKRAFFVGKKNNSKFVFEKMIIWDLDGNKEIELGNN